MTRFPIPCSRSVLLVTLSAVLMCCVSPVARLSQDRPTFSDSAFKYEHTVDVGDVDTDNMVSALKEFTREVDAGAKRITLRIDSSGGSIFLGFKWIQLITDLKKSKGVAVDCIVDGTAYSMAAVILESPVCDVRLATPASTLLFHNGQGGAKGGEQEIENGRMMLSALNSAIAYLIAQRMQMTPEEYRAQVANGRNWILASQEALARHAIDGVVSSEEIAPPAAG